jgi:hypothetical protein
MVIDAASRVEFRQSAYDPINPIYVVVNVLEEGDHVMEVFVDRDFAYDYALTEAELNELDQYAIIRKELN